MSPSPRLRALAVLLTVVHATQRAAAYPCTPHNRSTCAAPPGGLPPARVPQFITITWDDAVTGQPYGLVHTILGGLKQRNGCPVPSTFFATVTDTEPSAVQALYLQGNEIATHTINHVGYPSQHEIVGCRTWLANRTGIPASKITGFRAPFLLHDASTRRALAAAGFQYDSSMADTLPSLVSKSAHSRAWPYRMSKGIPQKCETGSCSPRERYQLWEIPLWGTTDAQGRPLDTMDPPGDAFQLYKRQLEQRLAGNRAPLGLFFHSGLESQPDRVAQLRRFVQLAAAKPDVWFVTNQQLLAWMAAPVPASRVAASLGCKPPTDIKRGVRACATFVSDCVYGSWDGTRCRCTCIGQGGAGGYCRDRCTGACTRLC